MNRKADTISFYRKRLPHWSVKDALYFVTLSQKDSIPKDAASKLHKKSEELRSLPEEEQIKLRRFIFLEMEKWLDSSKGKSFLSIPEISRLIVESIDFKEKRGDWHVNEYVVMPNHIHMFVEIKKGSLKENISLFKRWTGHKAAMLLHEDNRIAGKSFKTENSSLKNNFWHREWFDHWSRSADQDEKIKRYIRNNPVKAGLVKRYEDWPYGSWSRSPDPRATP